MWANNACSKPLLLLKTVGVSAPEPDGFGVERVAVKMVRGTAAFPRVVRNASLGVERRSKPAICVNF